MAACCGSVNAGERAWTQDAVSPAINYRNVAVAARYTPKASATPTPASRITRVQATHSYRGNVRIQTRLCWSGSERCVSLNGAGVSTHEFDGLNADRAMYLVHTAVDSRSGPLPSPVFVKGSVVVWYEP